MSMPSLLLRLEELTVFVSAIALYAYLQGNGWVFILLLLTPDLSALGYLVNTRVGSITYNIAHTYLVPLAIILLGYATGQMGIILFGIIWFAHIGMDRVVGYGLKYPDNFKSTHLNRV